MKVQNITNVGIYKITCKVTNKFYIGSSVNLKRRKYWHFYELNRNIHKNKHLQSAYNKHGNDKFVFEVIEHLPETYAQQDVLMREQYFIDLLQPWKPKVGFNKCKVVGQPHERTRFKHSQKTKEMFSTQRANKPKSDEFKQALSLKYRGKSMCERTNDPNWVCNKKGKTMKEITKNENWTDPKVGRHHKQQSVKLMSQAKCGENNPMFNPKLISLVNQEGILQHKTRYEWNKIGVNIRRIIKKELKKSKGWMLP